MSVSISVNIFRKWKPWINNVLLGFQLQQRNGRTRLLPKSWSPQHMVAHNPPAPAHDMNETLSSSDTDSDEDVWCDSASLLSQIIDSRRAGLVILVTYTLWLS